MRFIISILISVVIIATAYLFSKPLPDTGLDESFLPKAEYVRYLSAGHEVTASGLFWIRGLIDLGGSYLSGEEYAYLGHVGELATQLDSLFYTPYYFVGGVTPISSKDTSDFSVMRRAHRVFPEDWRLALYFAIRLANGPFKNNAEAAEIMRSYSTSKDTSMPEYIRKIHRTFEIGAMQTEIAIQTILEDCVKPEYKGFKNSFYAKTIRVLGYDPLEKRPETEEIKKTIDGIIAQQMHPQYAYERLLRLKKEPEETTEIKE
ncbi:MAG: hypothetical protein GX545_07205 [Fibrobacter sp.]|jgi:hypothetical protein|nr:hypothetical protein [Fibrobacter sp.]